ncbi:MAG TPA: hypothetical protein VKY45_00505 [Marinilabiliaceae bacterium]|nr:hypothetical protein [Marinilabiliaceae bacterium]
MKIIEGGILMKRAGLIVLFIGVLLLCTNTYVLGEVEDSLDLSQYQDKVSELGVPTLDSVTGLKNQAIQTFESGDYEQALPLLEDWAKQANWLANLISGGLEPFYSASYDDRKEFPYSKISILVSYESTANDLKTQRDHSLVMQAECLSHLGNKKDAVARYMKALDLIGIDDWEWWVRATNGLYEIIGIPSMKE